MGDVPTIGFCVDLQSFMGFPKVLWGLLMGAVVGGSEKLQSLVGAGA